jgi:hypothetical protein
MFWNQNTTITRSIKDIELQAVFVKLLLDADTERRKAIAKRYLNEIKMKKSSC